MKMPWAMPPDLEELTEELDRGPREAREYIVRAILKSGMGLQGTLKVIEEFRRRQFDYAAEAGLRLARQIVAMGGQVYEESFPPWGRDLYDQLAAMSVEEVAEEVLAEIRSRGPEGHDHWMKPAIEGNLRRLRLARAPRRNDPQVDGW